MAGAWHGSGGSLNTKNKERCHWMTTPIDRANQLNALHVKGNPLILFNIWDAGSAQAVQATGAKAIYNVPLHIA